MKSEVVLPRINTNDNDVEIVKWHVEDYALVEKGADLVEVSTSKAVVVIEANAPGYVKLDYAKGAVVSVGKILVSIFDTLNDAKAAGTSLSGSGNPSAEKKSSQPSPADLVSMPTGSFGFNRLSKAAQALAKEKNLDPKSFEGTGLVSARSLIQVPKTIPFERESKPVKNEPVVSEPSFRSEKVSRNKKFEIDALTAGQSGNINSSITAQFNSDKVRATLKSLGALNGQMLPLMIFELSRL